ncbi:MAG: hypothetical protein GX657_03980 [Chloroflexi bacterium]|nr:hypothetical protein [Chloroflexota bacterium]
MVTQFLAGIDPQPIEQSPSGVAWAASRAFLYGFAYYYVSAIRANVASRTS